MAIKAGTAMASGAATVATECKAGWDLRGEILAEEKEAALRLPLGTEKV